MPFTGSHPLLRWWRRTPVAPVAERSQRVARLSRTAAVAVWTAIAAATLAGAGTGARSAVLTEIGVRAGLFRIVTWGGGAGLAAVLGCAAVLALVVVRRSRTAPVTAP